MSNHFFYPPNQSGNGGMSAAAIRRLDPNKHWAKHAQIEMALKRISADSKDARTKMLAEQEILVAVRKQKWWERHVNYDPMIASSILKSSGQINHQK